MVKCFGRYRLFVSQKRKFPCQIKIDVSLNSSDFAHKPLSRISSIVTVLNSTFACRLILLLYNIIHNHNIYTEMYKTPYWLCSKMYIILQIGIFSFLISSYSYIGQSRYYSRLTAGVKRSWLCIFLCSYSFVCFWSNIKTTKRTHRHKLVSSRQSINQREIKRVAIGECA